MHPKKGKQAVVAAVLGNILEWYDFGVYAFFAGIIGKTFFPADDPTMSLLTSFAVFGVGFFFRPLGAAVIGKVGDVKGRKTALLITIFMMAVGTTLIGIVPSYATIGMAAPLLIVLARLIQGFSAGGEWGGSTSFMVEWAPNKGRGFYGSFQQASTVSGLLLGSAIAALVSTVFAPEVLESWAWRLPFLFGAILGPVGLWMRRSIDETPAFVESQKEQAAKVKAAAETQATAGNTEDSTLVACARCFGFSVVWTASFYIFLNYMPTFTKNHAGLTQAEALWASTICLISLTVLIPFFGNLSDRIGRKPLLLACCISMIILPYPFMKWMVSGAGFAMIILMEVVLAVFISMFSGAGPAAIAEIFPTNSRSFLLSVSYALATTIFGGFAPYIATKLIQVTEDPVAPAFYVALGGVISLITIWKMRETAFDKLK